LLAPSPVVKWRFWMRARRSPSLPGQERRQIERRVLQELVGHPDHLRGVGVGAEAHRAEGDILLGRRCRVLADDGALFEVSLSVGIGRSLPLEVLKCRPTSSMPPKASMALSIWP
jgi:hypothetical protein